MIKKSKLSGAIDPCVRIFSFFCFADVSLAKAASVREKLDVLWVLLKYLVMIGILGFMFIDSVVEGQINRLRDSHTGIIIHLLIFVMTASQGFVSLVQTLASSSKSSRFIERLRRVDELLASVSSVVLNYDKLRQSLLVRLIASLLFYIASSIVVVFSVVQKRPQIWRLAVSHHIAILLGRIFMQRFIFMVQLLSFYLEGLADALEKSIAQRRLGDETKARNLVKVQRMQVAYRMIWDASVLINESFDIGAVDVMCIQCLSLFYQSYTLCIDTTRRETNHRQFLSILTTLFEIFSTHYYCQQCLNSVISPINNRDSIKIFPFYACPMIDRFSPPFFSGKTVNVPDSSTQQWSTIIVSPLRYDRDVFASVDASEDKICAGELVRN